LSDQQSVQVQREWYLCGTTVVVFCGAFGTDGLYRIVASPAARWEFCPIGTRLWDWYHQAAFYAHRAEPTRALDHPELPPLPAGWPPDPATTRLDETESSVHAQPGGAIWRVVERAGGELPVFIVLEEDTYETALGDGCFRDFRAAFYDESAARAAAAKTTGTHQQRHLRRAWLRIEAGELQLTIAAKDHTPFDHVTLADVCKALVPDATSPA
jgi:hypothetical protein